jgi:hypothetical protein
MSIPLARPDDELKMSGVRGACTPLFAFKSEKICARDQGPMVRVA